MSIWLGKDMIMLGIVMQCFVVSRFPSFFSSSMNKSSFDELCGV